MSLCSIGLTYSDIVLDLMLVLSCLATIIGPADHLTLPHSLLEAHVFSKPPTSADQLSPVMHTHSIPNTSFLPIRACAKAVYLLGSYHSLIMSFKSS